MKYPMFCVSQWIDTSPEAMNKPQATIIYGVQTKRKPGGSWMHVARDTEPVFFDTHEKALAYCDELRKAAKADIAAG